MVADAGAGEMNYAINIDESFGVYEAADRLPTQLIGGGYRLAH